MPFSSFKDAHEHLLRLILHRGQTFGPTLEVVGVGYAVDGYDSTSAPNGLHLDAMYVDKLPRPGLHSGYVDSVTTDMIQLMKKDLGTRQAVCVPFKNAAPYGGHPPCIVAVQFLVRGNKLHCYMFQRSGEILRKVPRDYLAWREFQHQFANELGVAVGEFHHYITSAHIYLVDMKLVKV